MATVRVISKAEARQTKMPKAIGARRQRMDQFDALAAHVHGESTEDQLRVGAASYILEPEDGSPQAFVLSLRQAFKRAGVPAHVRKLRGRAEVRAWLTEPDAAAAPHRQRRKRLVEPKRELAGVGA